MTIHIINLFLQITVGNTYMVQWGLSKKDTDKATVLFAGNDEDVHATMKTTLENDNKKKKRKVSSLFKKKKKAAFSLELVPAWST